MSFFDVPIPDVTEPEVVERPEWSGPRAGVLPGYSTQRAVLFRTNDTLLLVHQFLVYPTGVEFNLSLFVKDGTYELGDVPWELHRPPRGGSIPDEFLRFGIQLADGPKWTNLDWRHPGLGKEAAGLVAIGRGGGGGGDSWEMGYWLWPLPPDGPVTFVASWPVRGIGETTAVVDGSEIRSRLAEAETIWAD